MPSLYEPEPDDQLDLGVNPDSTILHGWLSRRVFRLMEKHFPEDWGRDPCGAAVAHICEEPRTILKWVDYDEFRGDGFSHGAWTIDTAALEKRIPDALIIGHLKRETLEYPTFDDFLRAVGAGEAWSGPPERVIDRAPDATPGSRSCIDCGRVFVKRGKARLRCPTCATKERNRKAKREIGRRAALEDGAAYLARVLDEAKAPALPIEASKERWWLSEVAVESWKAGTSIPYAGALRAANAYWQLEELEIAAAEWAFRPSTTWPNSVRQVLETRMIEWGIWSSGESK